VACESMSASEKPVGSGSFVSTETTRATPQRWPLEAMLASRRALVSVKLAGKLATTTNR